MKPSAIIFKNAAQRALYPLVSRTKHLEMRWMLHDCELNQVPAIQQRTRLTIPAIACGEASGASQLLTLQCRGYVADAVALSMQLRTLDFPRTLGRPEYLLISARWMQSRRSETNKKHATIVAAAANQLGVRSQNNLGSGSTRLRTSSGHGTRRWRSCVAYAETLHFRFVVRLPDLRGIMTTR